MRAFFITVIFLTASSLWYDAAAETDVLGLPVDNRALEWSTTALIVADWGQTLDIADSPDRREKNSWIGWNPGRRHVNTYFTTKLATHYIINSYKPLGKYKNIWNIWQFLITIQAVKRNNQVGLSIKF